MSYILVVEDDDTLRSLTKVILELDGYKVKLAANCNEAKIIMNKDKPCLVLLDYLLGMERCDPVVAIANSYYPEPIPVILVSGWSKIAENAKSLKIQYWISKPYDIDELANTIRQIIPAEKLSKCSHTVPVEPNPPVPL